MLLELSISNLAIIEMARLSLEPGFSVLTGETGAGKSIIVDAVMLLLGGRALADMVRTGCDMAFVEGVFAPEAEVLVRLQPILDEYGLADDSGEIIITREIRRSRRNICRVNGRTVTLGTLQELGSNLIDIHGQGEHLSLMHVQRHVDYLDEYGGLLESRRKVAALVAELWVVRSKLEELQRDKRAMARRTDLLSYQIDEIDAARLQEGEEEELVAQRRLLANAEQRLQLAASIYAALMAGVGRQQAAVDLIGNAFQEMGELLELDDSLREEADMLEASLYQLEETARAVRAYRDQVEFDPEGLAAAEDRLDLIRGLKRKYGDSISEILSFCERARQELEGISHSEERIAALREQEQSLLSDLAQRAGELSAARGQAAEALSQAIEKQLSELNMDHARFIVDLGQSEEADGVQLGDRSYRFDRTGIDRVEFLIAPNPGEEPQPLARIASGGETSRLMLAMKTALSTVDPVPTLIFDEIDAGIGGRTGDVVGQKLRRLADERQVFCVTHLPQIARYARQHYQVAKAVVGERTVSTARLLPHEERVEELAVMLGGAATESNRRSAAELLKSMPT